MTGAGADPFKGSDRFTVTRRIGQGGMGVVYEAHDRLRQMPVAVKTIESGDPTALYRFKREFRSLSNITHRNLATLYELFAEATPWFFTMELVTGVTFLEHVRPSGSAEYQRLSAALTELVAGLSALHSCKKLHRDVKPPNVLVEPDGRVVVLDFGLVMDLDGGSLGTFSERDWFGTLAYMAPEQATGDILTPAADWYAVGGLLFQALTGRLPFDGEHRRSSTPSSPGTGPPLATSTPTRRRPSTDSARGCCGAIRTNVRQDRRLSTSSSPGPRSGSHGPPAVHERPMALIGREAHLAALEAPIESVRRDRSVVMLVHGPSGSGKPHWSRTSSIGSACTRMCSSSRAGATRENRCPTRRSTASSTS